MLLVNAADNADLRKFVNAVDPVHQAFFDVNP
jgi:hypothetical protein